MDISFPPPAPVQTSDRDLPDARYSLFPVLFCQSGCGNSVPFREDPGWQTFHSFPLTAKLHGANTQAGGPVTQVNPDPGIMLIDLRNLNPIYASSVLLRNWNKPDSFRILPRSQTVYLSPSGIPEPTGDGWPVHTSLLRFEDCRVEFRIRNASECSPGDTLSASSITLI